MDNAKEALKVGFPRNVNVQEQWFTDLLLGYLDRSSDRFLLDQEIVRDELPRIRRRFFIRIERMVEVSACRHFSVSNTRLSCGLGSRFGAQQRELPRTGQAGEQFVDLMCNRSGSDVNPRPNSTWLALPCTLDVLFSLG